jgi:hypothetical protein
MTRNKANLFTSYSDLCIRLVGVCVLVAALVAINPAASLAQAAAPVDPPKPAALAVPTVKLLAIGSLTAKATPKELMTILPSEARETVRLYLGGKIDQWYSRQDQGGVVFIMNLTDPKEAHELLEKLPLGQAGLMEFQLIPLGPLKPLTTLLGESPRP